MNNADIDLERVVAAARGIELAECERHALKRQAPATQAAKLSIMGLWDLLKIRKPAAN